MLKRRQREQVIVFTRWPEAGQAKTRLIPALGAEGAAALHRRMTEHVLLTALPPSWACTIAFSGAARNAMQQWLGRGFRYEEQTAGDLGNRMGASLDAAFTRGAARAVIIGTDCPQLLPSHVNRAFAELATHDLVIGPAHDGGYYLIGLTHGAWRRACAALFCGVAWGTGAVREQTLQNAVRSGLATAQLDTLSDVDLPEDLPVWRGAARRSRIAVVIPCSNEATHVAAAVASAKTEDDAEVIVVDGGSDDGTPDAVKAAGARVVSARPGRGVQMNAGARASSGGILLFLHADCTLPPDYGSAVRRTLCQPGAAIGAFSLHIDDASRNARIMSVGANTRSRLLHMPYGDQALFLRRRLFEEIGGFQEAPLLEDSLLVREAARHGNVLTAPEAVRTSARRWQRRGWWRTFFINLAVISAFRCGVSPERLARWYHR